MRVLLTGMSGAGKTTVLDELGRRGLRSLDTDYGGGRCRTAGGMSRG